MPSDIIESHLNSLVYHQQELAPIVWKYSTTLFLLPTVPLEFKSGVLVHLRIYFFLQETREIDTSRYEMGSLLFLEFGQLKPLNSKVLP